MIRIFIIAFISFISVIHSHSQQYIDLQYLRSYSLNEITPQFGSVAEYGVDLYKMRYLSPDLNDNQDTLSGLVAVPVASDLLFPLMVYSHGTVDSRESVPSRLSAESLLSTFFASAGYVVIAPDLLGLGDSEGVHPYLHAESTARSSFDMLVALKENENTHGIFSNQQIFITGYSQGGHSAMALQRHMEGLSDSDYTVTASAPMSGPYSLSSEMFQFTIGDQEYFFPAYLANVALSFQEVYGDILGEEGLASIFKPEYVDEMMRFVNEEIGLSALNNILINRLNNDFGMVKPKFMFKDDVLEDILSSEAHPFRMALKDNDVYDWAPKVPTRLFYCRADDQVVYTNSTRAEAEMKSNGSNEVIAVNAGNTENHGQCVPNAVTLTYLFFRQFQNVTNSARTPENLTELKIFPNPAQSYVFIENGHSQTGRILLYDLYGRLVLNEPYITGTPLDVSSMLTGYYIMHLRHDNESLSAKFIISR